MCIGVKPPGYVILHRALPGTRYHLWREGFDVGTPKDLAEALRAMADLVETGIEQTIEGCDIYK